MSLSDKILFIFLLIIDRLLGTSLTQREVNRRRAKLADYKARLETIEEQLTRLENTLETLNLRLCLLYLWERNLTWPDRWLRFDPATPQDDRELDLLISYLVKPRLATIDEEKVATDHYVYHLKPDWAAIRDLLTSHQVKLESDLRLWLDSQHYTV
jgi:fructosamine-3-kinase